MNRSILAMISTSVSASDFFACSISMPRIKYHDPGYKK